MLRIISPTWIFTSEWTGALTIKTSEQTIMALEDLDWLLQIKHETLVHFSVTELAFDKADQKTFELYRTVNENEVVYEIVCEWDQRIQSSDVEEISEWLWQII